MHFHWTEKSNQPGLQKLVAQCRTEGGKLVRYERVWSLFVLTSASPVIEWVPPNRSRIAAGFRHSLFTAAFGWWSIAGFFWTLACLIGNTFGGADVTSLYLTPKSDIAQEEVNRAIRRIERLQALRLYIFIGVVLLLVGLVVGYFITETRRMAAEGR